MNRLRKGDEVIVIAGKDKGRRGTVLEMRQDGRVLVEGINMAKKHVRPNPNAGIQGGIVEQEMPIDDSNIMLFNSESGKGERVGIQLVEGKEGTKKIRVFRPSGKPVDA